MKVFANSITLDTVLSYSHDGLTTTGAISFPNLHLYNSYTRRLEEFIPLETGKVGLYCCGPTVYNYAHIGNLRAFTHWDILRRTLEYFGYDVKHVMNITDVGHLTDDSDEGEDKMLKASHEKGMSVWEIAQFFTEAFFKDIGRLNILRPTISCKATEHIAAMITLVEKLEKKGLTYKRGGNVYFDTAQFPKYGKMALLDRQQLQHGSSVEIDRNKKNPLDFVLWFTKSKFKNPIMVWDSPWGKGYPGWHLECSAMSSHYLGERFDIHTGGVDHIAIHHSNEIAQSEGAFGHKWVTYWIHNEFLIIKGEKMSKEKNDFLTLQSLLDRGYDALDYRYFLLEGHYRSQRIFSSESLDAAHSARRSLEDRVEVLLKKTGGATSLENLSLGPPAQKRLQAFNAALADDMNTPRALAEIWGLIKEESINEAERLAIIQKTEGVLGLCLIKEDKKSSPLEQEITTLLARRDKARAAKDWATADALRDELLKKGWKVEDRQNVSQLKKS